MSRHTLVLCSFLLLAPISMATADTWHVPLNAPTIQAGIDSSAAGDTVIVACNTYYEYDIYMKSGVYLTSETGEADCATIDGESQGYMFRCHGTDMTTHIVGFTVTGGRANFGGGIICTDESPNITNCLFVDNEGIQQGGGLQFENCDPTVTGCTVVNNIGPQGGGVYLHNASPTFENMIIAFNTGLSFYRTSGSSSPTLSCCDIYGNTEEDWVDWISGQLGIDGNISEDPLFCGEENSPGQPFTLSDTSPCAAENNAECGLIGALPIGCHVPITWHVPLDAPTIQAGIDSSAAGDTVIVACNTYYEYDIYMKSGVYLTSETGEADCVTIDGESQGYMFRCHSTDNTTHIVGFTVTGGRANFGGGIICTDESPNITNCLFVDNEGVQQGGGLQFENCDPTVTGCTVVNNIGPQGGGVYLHNASPTFENTIIAFNTGLSFYRTSGSSSPTLSCCDIYGNTEGDWVDWISGQLGFDGNISEDPVFCGEDYAPGQPYMLADISPCAPENNLECGLIGALPVGCSFTPTEVTTWGTIKAGFRE